MRILNELTFECVYCVSQDGVAITGLIIAALSLVAVIVTGNPIGSILVGQLPMGQRGYIDRTFWGFKVSFVCLCILTIEAGARPI